MSKTYGNNIAVFRYLKFNDYAISEMIKTIKNSEKVLLSFYCARFGFECSGNRTILLKCDFSLGPSFLAKY